MPGLGKNERETDNFCGQALSVIFTPFYLPLVGLAVLLTFTYLSLLPWAYKLFLVVTFWVFTIALPSLLIRLYRRYQGWSLFSMASKERRVIPYVISIVSYLLCYYIMAAATCLTSWGASSWPRW